MLEREIKLGTKPVMEIYCTPRAVVLVDGEPRDLSPQTVAIEAGEHRVECAAGTATIAKTVKLRKGQRERLDLIIPEVLIEEVQHRRATFRWIGASMFATGVTLGVLSAWLRLDPMQNEIDERDDAYDTWLLAARPGAAELEDEIKDHDSQIAVYNALSWVGLLSGAILSAGGMVSWMHAPDDPQAIAADSAPRWMLSPAAGRDQAGILGGLRW